MTEKTLEEKYENNRKERKKKATESQQKAANPHFSVWVEASAGTGKTKVLSDRVVRLLLDELNPRILCLTYTKAAAVEMKTRISKRLSEWSVQSDEKLIKNIKELLGNDADNEKKLAEYVEKARTLFAALLDNPGGIKIQTIHAFCEEVLKRFPLEAGVSPYFEILGDREAAEALEEIKNETLRESNLSTTPESTAVQYLASHLSEQGFSEVMKHITINRAKISDYGDISDILNELQRKTGIKESETEEVVKAKCMSDINKFELQKNIVSLKSGGKRCKDKAVVLEEVYKSGCLPEDFDKYMGSFISKSSGEIYKESYLTDNSAQKADSELLFRMQNEAYRILDTIKKCCKIRLYNSTKAFLTVAQSINNKYEAYKRAKSCLDYEDLINKTCMLLKDDKQAIWVLYKLDGGIDHILLDEAQDTSPKQWDIIKALSREFFDGKGAVDKIRTVFVVGDRKQSIFSFQGADPRKFDKMREYFEKHGGANFIPVNMEYSFRSTPAVLKEVNDVFSDENVAKGVITEGSSVQHMAVRAGEFGRVEIWPLYVAEKGEEITDEQKLLPPVEMSKKISVRTKMAEQIVKKIKQMMDDSKKTDNPLRYKDFMVLVRQRNAFVNEFIRACKKEHVNISGADRMVLSEQIAVQDLISLGKFLLLPNDDLSLAEVLKSPLFNLTDEDLEDLCCERESAPLWTKLGDSKKQKCKDAYSDLQELFNELNFVRPYELFNYVLINLDGRKKFMRRMGIEAEDALDEFINLTLAYEQQQTPSLQGFISWFENDKTAIKREGDDSESDAVRLMTVHHSKGLQARVVFLPDSVQLPRNNNEQKLLFDDDLILYPLCKDDYDELSMKINEKYGNSISEEYRRLLYVALTRAEEQLIVCGYANSENIKEDSWLRICERTTNNTSFAKDEEERSIMEIPAYVKAEVKEKYFIEPLNKTPEAWIENDPKEEVPLAKPFTPSRPDDEEEPDSVSPLENGANYYRRGSLIHKILQFLPPDNSDKAQIIDEYMKRNVADFSDEEKKQIKEEILNLLIDKEYEMIFGADSRAEVPVFGEVDGKIISAQIDRLVIQKDKITIVDFKTNRPASKTLAETPEVYKKQLKTYETLVRKIYPDRAVESYILWTNDARLMRVS